MDPATASGLALSGVSLAFQIFSGCIKGYQLLIEANALPKTHEYLRVSLQLQQYRILTWAMVTDVPEREGPVAESWEKDHSTALDALKQAEAMLRDLVMMHSRCDYELIECHSDLDHKGVTGSNSLLKTKHSELRRKALDLARQLRKYPKRLRWVVFSASKLELLLSRLIKLNDSMASLLDAHQAQRFSAIQDSILAQVVQTRHKVDGLSDLVQSLMSALHTSSVTSTADRKYLGLSRFKTLSVAIENESTSERLFLHPDLQRCLASRESLPMNNLKLDTLGTTTHAIPSSALSRSGGTYNGESVWIEWRAYLPSDSGLPPKYVQDRISKLAILLREGQTQTEFITPQCLGYVHQPNIPRFGFVFKRSLPSRNPVPTSLSRLLEATRKPPLTTRVEVARIITTSLWYLHAVDWLHKGIRSENILFEDEGNLSRPLLSGFDYSRPAKPGEITDGATQNRRHDLYRHPGVQFDSPRDGKYGYRMVHDVYSLGVVLFEIGTWRSIDRFLEIPPDKEIPLSVARGVGARLLNDQCLAQLAAEAGNIYANCVKFCLERDINCTAAPMQAESEDLHRTMEDVVLAGLQSIRV